MFECIMRVSISLNVRTQEGLRWGRTRVKSFNNSFEIVANVTTSRRDGHTHTQVQDTPLSSSSPPPPNDQTACFYCI